jgi:ketosteroid isomerase-like protein
MMRRAVAPAIAVAIGMAACATQEQAAAPADVAVDTAAVLAGVADLWTKWVAADTVEDLEGQLALTTDNVRFDVKGMPPMAGKESARATLAPLYAQVDYLEAWITPVTTTAVSNDLAYQFGSYSERYTMKGQPGEMTDYSRYAAAAVKGPDGQWRWAYIMAFTDSTITRK